MGAITTNSGDALDGFLTKVGAARTSLIQAINSHEPLRAAFAEAEAKLILLEDITPEVGAYLLRFCDAKLDMVEVVNTNDKDAKIRAVAMAILNGFVPGREQFGIHTGKLYVKEAGYRKLFSKISGCSVPDVQVGHPDLAELKNGKKVWNVDGVATVTWHGTEYVVECVRDYAIGIPSHGTDHIDGIKTKARRRLLQLLWKKVSSVGLDDSEDEFAEQPSVRVVEPSKQIAAPDPVVQGSLVTPQEIRDKMIRAGVCCKVDRERAAKMLSKDPDAASTFQEIWQKLDQAPDLQELNHMGTVYAGTINTFSEPVQKALRAWYELRVLHCKHGRPEPA